MKDRTRRAAFSENLFTRVCICGTAGVQYASFSYPLRRGWHLSPEADEGNYCPILAIRGSQRGCNYLSRRAHCTVRDPGAHRRDRRRPLRKCTLIATNLAEVILINPMGDPSERLLKLHPHRVSRQPAGEYHILRERGVRPSKAKAAPGGRQMSSGTFGERGTTVGLHSKVSPSIDISGASACSLEDGMRR